MVNSLRPRDHHASLPIPWAPGRGGVRQFSDQGHFMGPPEGRRQSRAPSETIREFLEVPGRKFFLVAEHHGKAIYFPPSAGPESKNRGVFFNEEAFLTYMKQSEIGECQLLDESGTEQGTDANNCPPEPNRTTTRDRYHHLNNPVASAVNDGARRSNKRPRPNSRPESGNRRERVTVAAAPPKRSIRIGDSDAVYAFYDHQLKCCQQLACKIMGKAWVKAIAPRKQSHNPYTKGVDSRPDWWPATYRIFGEEEERPMRHKEPDHINKDERVYLLCHILRMLVEPRRQQHEVIQTAGLTVSSLEKITFDALSSWFNDKKAPRNMSKRPFLKELFRVATHEAHYKDGGLDGNTEIFVSSVSENEANKWSDSDCDDDEDVDMMLTPGSSTQNGSPIMMTEADVNEPSGTANFPSHTFSEAVPLRPAHYTHSEFEHGMPERPNYAETSHNYGHGHLGLSDMYSSPHETSRRPSVFNSPTDYASPATPVVYSPWPGPYAFPPPASGVQGFGGQIAQGSYATASIDGLPRADMHHADVFAPRNASQNAIQHPTGGYANYGTEGQHLGPDNTKSDRGHHPPTAQ